MQLLFKNNVWEIYSNVDKNELICTDGYSTAYAYISVCGKKLYWDRMITPKYINKKCIQLAKKHNIKSIYK